MHLPFCSFTLHLIQDEEPSELSADADICGCHSHPNYGLFLFKSLIPFSIQLSSSQTQQWANIKGGSKIKEE